jgi:hypothetical protein
MNVSTPSDARMRNQARINTWINQQPLSVAGKSLFLVWFEDRNVALVIASAAHIDAEEGATRVGHLILCAGRKWRVDCS